MIFVSAWSCFCPIHCNWLSRWEWRCRCSNADMRCSNYMWVIMNLIASYGAAYITDLMVVSYLIYVGYTILCAIHGLIFLTSSRNIWTHLFVNTYIFVSLGILYYFVNCITIFGRNHLYTYVCKHTISLKTSTLWWIECRLKLISAYCRLLMSRGGARYFYQCLLVYVSVKTIVLSFQLKCQRRGEIFSYYFSPKCC